MKKKFNITGVCIPEMHYMVNTTTKIENILELIENREYFSINRPRQYGKTTTFFILYKELQKRQDYLCIETSFEGIGVEAYKNAKLFIPQFIYLLKDTFELQNKKEYFELLNNIEMPTDFKKLSKIITQLATLSKQKLVLLIDEVDKSMNNQLFLDFLAMLRNKYLNQAKGTDYSFHSVILAGVHDVKTLKLKINPDTELKNNSPWNIAADFIIDMSFNPQEISTMLIDYVNDKKIKMDIPEISKRIYYYTSGYPFLVSKICKEIDEKILPQRNDKNWNINDIETVVKTICLESNTNFSSLSKNIENDPELYNFVVNLLLGSKTFTFVKDVPLIDIAYTHGIIDNYKGKVKIHNKIYEEYLTNYVVTKMQTQKVEVDKIYDVIQSSYITPAGKLNFEKVLLKFQEVIKEKYSKSEVLKSDEFLEKDLRLLFLVFLKPIINGIGFSFKEVETSEEKRLDIVVLFENEKFIVELKLWRGQEYHLQGIERLKDYMRRENANKSYMLIMDKTRHKEFTTNIEDNILMVWI